MVSGRGGGIALIYRKSIIVKTLSVTNVKSFENMDFAVSHRKQTVRVVCQYHSPPPKKNRLTDATFHEEVGKLVCSVTRSNKNLMILEDFNVHLDSPQDRDSKLLIQLLDSLDLCQHVSQPTHRQGHVFDWVISRSRSVHSNIVQSITVEGLQISDHFFVTV